ncbi:hypothetical protein HYV82_06570 [Candidatus Woesearchaeota archaeon]|nr:hypothetical protein [Candidatus Woesearchaeota archaeon]
MGVGKLPKGSPTDYLAKAIVNAYGAMEHARQIANLLPREPPDALEKWFAVYQGRPVPEVSQKAQSAIDAAEERYNSWRFVRQRLAELKVRLGQDAYALNWGGVKGLFDQYYAESRSNGLYTAAAFFDGAASNAEYQGTFETLQMLRGQMEQRSGLESRVVVMPNS